MSNQIAVVLSRNRRPDSQRQLLEENLFRGLADRRGLEVTVIPHLYDLAPDGPAVSQLRAMPGDLVVLCWLYPRAAYWTLDANGVHGRLGPTSSLEPDDVDAPGPRAAAPYERTIWCFDLRTHVQPEPFLGEIDRLAGTRPEAVAAAPPPTGVLEPYEAASRESVEAVRTRWYPVIDRSRCTNCLECLNFCLFGVYSVGQDNGILIDQPDACRPGCPACSRICPQGAIMFPEHSDPAIAGDPAASREGMKLDLSQLFRGADPAQLAALERQRAIQGRQPTSSTAPGQSDSAARNTAPSEDRLDRLVDEVDGLEL